MPAKPKLNLSTKILLIALINLAFIAAVLAFYMHVQYRFDLQSFLISPAHDRILSTGRQIALELRDTDISGWDQLLQRYADANNVELQLTDDDGRRLAGSSAQLPASVLESLAHRSHDDGRDSPLLFLGTTTRPSKHWVGIRIPIPASNQRHHVHGVLVAASSSLLGTPFFFDPKPWIAVAIALVLISILCWIPFGRRLVGSISEIKRVTGQIAEGQFKIHIPIKRHDELGQLSTSINRLATRLEGYVADQKRFLGDTAHELCSPIARMQVATGILERSAEGMVRETVSDLREDLEQMSKLVNDVLSFSKAGLLGRDVKLAPIKAADVVRAALERELGQSGQSVQLMNNVPSDIEVLGDRDLLERAFSNVIRNSIRYAGSAGPITLTGSCNHDKSIIRISDCGPGLPESEIDRIFDPFYRLERSRSSESGGVGLGLAIVKSSVEACGGSVTCRNLPQRGLEVEIRLSLVERDSALHSETRSHLTVG
jgi:two-component system, OmpR family, sensor histidine kinase CpxA